MARRPKLRLTATTVKNTKLSGAYADGDGLYLIVTPSGTKNWQYRFMWLGKRKEMGLGSAADITLAEARAKREAAARLVEAGKNPIIERQVAAVVAVPSPSSAETVALTFGPFALAMIEEWAPGWKTTRLSEDDIGRGRTGKQKQNWEKTVRDYARLLFDLPVADVSTDHILAVLKPLWGNKQEAANKTRRRVERVLDAAKVKGLRSGENPARWKGHLEFLLARPKRKVRHHPAMPYEQIPAFLIELRGVDTRAARALEFLLFTLVRTTEVIFARKPEVDYIERVWTIPGDRMKGTDSPDHQVPLVDQALRIASRCSGATAESNPFLFGRSADFTAISPNGMDYVLQETLGYTQFTVHGFRSSFRDWAGDETVHDWEVTERSLAHQVGTATERAYRRRKALEKRRKLMQEWADFIDPPAVV